MKISSTELNSMLTKDYKLLRANAGNLKLFFLLCGNWKTSEITMITC